MTNVCRLRTTTDSNLFRGFVLEDETWPLMERTIARGLRGDPVASIRAFSHPSREHVADPSRLPQTFCQEITFPSPKLDLLVDTLRPCTNYDVCEWLFP